MKSQAELNQKNQVLKLISAEVVLLLKGTPGEKLLDKALVAMHGKSHGSYGDTSMPRNRRIAGDALADLISALEAVVTKANPHKQVISDEKLSKIRELCREKEGSLRYEVFVGGESVVEFKANSMAEAKTFGKFLKVGKHEIKRLTKAERNARSIGFATSPESEAYWCS